MPWLNVNKIAITVAAISILTVVIGGYIQYLRMSNEKLESTNKVLENNKIVLEEQQAQIRSDVRAIKRVQTEQLKLLQERNQVVKELDEKFTKQERDLGSLAVAKPGLIEKIVNDATENTISCLDILTDPNEKIDDSIAACATN